MRRSGPNFIITIAFITIAAGRCCIAALAQQPEFRNAPPSAAAEKNPYGESASAVAAGKRLYAKTCAQCHGNHEQGMGPAPALDDHQVRAAKPGAVFWFITQGKPSSGMPSWHSLSNQQRWQIVSFLQSKPQEHASAK